VIESRLTRPAAVGRQCEFRALTDSRRWATKFIRGKSAGRRACEFTLPAKSSLWRVAALGQRAKLRSRSDDQLLGDPVAAHWAVAKVLACGLWSRVRPRAPGAAVRAPLEAPDPARSPSLDLRV